MKINSSLVSGSGIGTMNIDSDENREQLAKTAEKSGDKLTISQEGKDLSKRIDASGATSKGDESKSSDPMDILIEKLKEQIEQVKKEIKELEQSNMPDEQKKELINSKRQQLTQLQSELGKAQEEKMKQSGMDSYGGTSAQGFSSSLT